MQGLAMLICGAWMGSRTAQIESLETNETRFAAQPEIRVTRERQEVVYDAPLAAVGYHEFKREAKFSIPPPSGMHRAASHVWRSMIVFVMIVLGWGNLLPWRALRGCSLKQLGVKGGDHDAWLESAKETVPGGSNVPMTWCQGGQLAKQQHATVQEAFADIARVHADRIAIVDGTGEQMTFGELQRASGTLCSRLQAANVQPDELVGLMTERGREMVAGMLGILTAGGAYVSCSASIPEMRLQSMLADAAVRVVVVAPNQLSHACAVLKGCYRIIECNALVDSRSHEPLPQPVPGRFIYALFTSGSTGKPKGVLLSQRAVMSVIREFEKVTAIDDSSVSLQTTPFTFDIHVCELYPFLLRGARTCLAPPGALTNLEELAAYCKRHSPTHAQFVPSVLSLALARHSLGEALTHLSVGGEAFPNDLAPLIFRRHGGIRCFNWHARMHARTHARTHAPVSNTS